MEQTVRNLFERYERFFAKGLIDQVDADELTSLYTPEFIAASPEGVTTGKLDETLIRSMSAGYERYRAIGTKQMRVHSLRISPIDEHHAVAHVGWTATYIRDDLPETTIDFTVHYLMQVRGDEAKVFGWIAGDEDAALKEHGII